MVGKRTIGIDEAGRGPWAGPLLVVAVTGEESALSYARDSKQLNPTKRQQLSIKIKRDAHEIGLGWVDSQLIDDLGLSKALNFAAKSAFSLT